MLFRSYVGGVIACFRLRWRMLVSGTDVRQSRLFAPRSHEEADPNAILHPLGRGALPALLLPPISLELPIVAAGSSPQLLAQASRVLAESMLGPRARASASHEAASGDMFF